VRQAGWAHNDSIGSRRPARNRITAAPSPAGFWPRLPVLTLFARYAPKPTLVLSANRGHLFYRELIGRKTFESLHLFRQADQDKQLVELAAQLDELRCLIALGVGADDLGDDLAALVA
jgi:hypothetical protein